MARRRILPRRLSHEEEATLVEHLTELRHRLVVCLLAIVPAFALAYAFHEKLIERLMELLPEGTPVVTLGVTEPFTTSLKVSFYASLAIVLPLLLWQVWSFLAPAVTEGTQRVLSVFVVLSTALFVGRCRVLLHDRPAEGARLPRRATTRASTSSRSGRATSSRSSR